MISTLMLKLFLLVICLTNICYAQNKPTNPWRLVANFEEQQLEGPPKKTNKETSKIFELIPEYKDGKIVTYDATQPKDDNKDESLCIEFDYYVNVPTIKEWALHLVLTDNETNQTRTLWSRYGFVADVWRTSVLEVKIQKGQFLQFRALTISGTIAFSEIRKDETFTLCQSSPFNTDFEDDVSNWEGTANLMASSVKRNTKDHTSDSEFGRVGVITSQGDLYPKIRVHKTLKCMRFWYNQLSNGSNETPTHFHAFLNGHYLFSTTKTVAIMDKWLPAQASLDFRHAGNYITIQAEKFNTNKDTGTVTLIDDIEFSEEECPDNAISCKFDGTTCDWTNAYYEELGLKWYLGSGRVMEKAYKLKNLPVPIHEKTIYTDFTKYVPNQTPVELQSPLLQDSNEYCAIIDIMYNKINAGDIFSLVQIVQTEKTEKTTLWQLNAVEAQKISADKYVEQTVQAEIPHSLYPRRLGLSALSSFPTCRMAVKEIKLIKGKCSAIPTPTPSSPSYAKSKLPHETLIIADELMKNSLTNVQHILNMIKIEDPIKLVLQKLLLELQEAVKSIEYNL